MLNSRWCSGWVLLGGAFLYGASGLSATLDTKPNSKKVATATLDEGESYEKGSTVCVFSEKNKKIDCGKITKLTKSKITIKFGGKKKMKPGLRVLPEGEQPEGDGVVSAGGKGKNADRSAAPATSPFRIWLAWNPAFSTPAVFNKIGYQAPTDPVPGTLWKKDKQIKATLAGAAVSAGIPLGPFSVNPGFRYRIFVPTIIDSDYIAEQENPYVSTEQVASSMGLFVDFQYYRMALGMIGVNLTSGLDFDSSSVKLTARKKDETGTVDETTIASADSSLTILSLRLGAATDIMFTKVFGANVGLNVLVPLAEMGKKFSSDISEEEARGHQDAGKDLQDSLGHGKGSIAFDMNLGITLAF